jgi:hypothetical protein
MNTSRIAAAAGALLLAIVALSAFAWAADQRVTIIGEVGEDFQVWGEDGQGYEIADTEKGNELVENMIGQKVKISGILTQMDEVLIIEVESYEVLAE